MNLHDIDLTPQLELHYKCPAQVCRGRKLHNHFPVRTQKLTIILIQYECQPLGPTNTNNWPETELGSILEAAEKQTEIRTFL